MSFINLFLPGRVAGLDDWLADAVGASLALICFKFGKKWMEKA